MNCILFTLHIPYYLFRPIEHNKLFEVMVNCGIGHLYPQFRNHSITLDNLWHVTQNMLEMMKIPLNDQITFLDQITFNDSIEFILLRRYYFFQLH